MHLPAIIAKELGGAGSARRRIALEPGSRAPLVSTVRDCIRHARWARTGVSGFPPVRLGGARHVR